MTAAEAAAHWGITSRRVRILCEQGRIKDAKQEIIAGKCTWTFPEQPKPEELKPGVKSIPRP